MTSETNQRARVMGVLNVTPDSFSDGGRLADVAAACAAGLALVAEGADCVDIGGESTRPGARPVSEDEERARVEPVVAALRAASPVTISVDTRTPSVAGAAVRAGATIWNDVSALGAPGAADLAAELGCDVILMHMAGEPATMQDAPAYRDVVGEVIGFLQARIEAALTSGVAEDRLWVDPGIGFGKTLAHNLALMAALPRVVRETGRPLVFGASRKRFIAGLDPSATAPLDRLGGSLAAALHAARMGAAMVRVHDVRETVQALAVQRAIETAGDER